MRKTIAILGRQPALGLAELESTYGSELVHPFGDHAVVHDIVTIEDFQRLGGSIRVGIVTAELDTAKWRTVEKYILGNIDSLFPTIDGKLIFGISAFGIKTSGREVAKTALLTKKAIKATGQSVRMVPHKSTEHNAATVLYNKLASSNGVELLVVSDGSKTLIGYTTAIQDIDAYAARDQKRPMRDAKVGMLPPKLAQIIVNIAVGKTDSFSRDNSEEQTSSKSRQVRILDPFCGTGVVLQEAMLMDYDIYGTDIEPRMIEYSIENLKWLDGLYPDAGDYRRVEMGDATRHKWHLPELITAVAGETFLGQPLMTLPPGDQLSKIIYEANVINHRFLQNIAKQLKPGTRLCLGVPTWRGKHEFLHLPMLDHLTDMGYTRMKFKHASNDDLIYHREGQIVGREVLVLIKD